MKRFSLLSLAACLAGANPATAATVFSEDFNGEAAALNSSLSQFAVTGSVDTVAAVNPYGIAVPLPASGNVLDINGTGAAGLITSLASFSVAAGDIVTLAFDLGGSQRGGLGDDFAATLLFAGVTDFSGLSGTGLFSGLSGSGTTTSLANSVFVTGDTPFTTSSISFISNGASSLRFAFGSPSQDNIGPLLDNISLRITRPSALPAVSAVPEPATWTMLLLGFGAVGFGMRRRRQITTSPDLA